MIDDITHAYNKVSMDPDVLSRTVGTRRVNVNIYVDLVVKNYSWIYKHYRDFTRELDRDYNKIYDIVSLGLLILYTEFSNTVVYSSYIPFWGTDALLTLQVLKKKLDSSIYSRGGPIKDSITEFKREIIALTMNVFNETDIRRKIIYGVLIDIILSEKSYQQRVEAFEKLTDELNPMVKTNTMI